MGKRHHVPVTAEVTEGQQKEERRLLSCARKIKDSQSQAFLHRPPTVSSGAEDLPGYPDHPARPGSPEANLAVRHLQWDKQAKCVLSIHMYVSCKHLTSCTYFS